MEQAESQLQEANVRFFIIAALPTGAFVASIYALVIAFFGPWSVSTNIALLLIIIGGIFSVAAVLFNKSKGGVSQLAQKKKSYYLSALVNGLAIAPVIVGAFILIQQDSTINGFVAFYGLFCSLVLVATGAAALREVRLRNIEA